MASYHFEPFFYCRRLRDMLIENKDSITFLPGQRNQGGKNVLGKIIVQDRVTVEAKVLPKYFNHSSFASLRRQLNYFSFVRLGKGRQRQSSYVNESVYVLDDILLLKRRPTGANGVPSNDLIFPVLQTPVPSSVETDIITSNVFDEVVNSKRTTKRRRLVSKGTPSLKTKRFIVPAGNCVSEDEHSEPKHLLDLTAPVESTDNDVLAGCSALLRLSSQTWM
ncbi:hypothetical protein FisN_3Lh359 [Fistulifera solaris]|uniref:HSF-type DNA-binding domain-containing protein n=1 Tax=Fistulifera solaris TaxID=1519565 RepID=A0A1Z5J841_FISSO|nr:hypothetical protein FisN_3Lh359 [Fistulifera solaris]|eukprot:GAX10163.1 hypothetical protein FisN_3Lh359 [Fistulifera solaris]